jgi:hypothetical protein
MSETFHAANLGEAIRMAEEFKKDKKYNLFRGQARNWPVMSSLGRLLPDPDSEIQKKLERLFIYFDTDPVLRKYNADIDWFWAVAQHYGIPTNYIDFTSDPKVAAFFATNSRSNSIGEQAVIICLNEKDWTSFMSGFRGYFESEKVIPPYIARIDVDNLWRLQAQKGCFLFSAYNNIEFFYDFDRILFPYEMPFREIRSSNIYPKRKSELEILLDRYFNMEERIQGGKRLAELAESLNIPVTKLEAPEFDHFFKEKSKHHSWGSEEFKKWDFPLVEKWEVETKSVHLHLNHDDDIGIDDQLTSLEKMIRDFFKKRKVGRMTPIKFFLRSKQMVSVKELKVINRNCSRVWEGTRNLPYTDEEIIRMLALIVTLSVMKCIHNRTYSFEGEEMLLLEMTNVYGNSSRCRVSPSVILNAFRTDLNKVLADTAPTELQPEILLHINDPFLLFDFYSLLEAFKKEMVCYQVLRQRYNDNPVIFFSPTQINVLGYA